MFSTFQSLRIRRVFWFLTIFDRLVKISPGSVKKQKTPPPLDQYHIYDSEEGEGGVSGQKAGMNRPWGSSG